MAVLMCPPIGVNTAQGRWLKGPGLCRAWGGWCGWSICARLWGSPTAEPGSPGGLSLGLCWLQRQLLRGLPSLSGRVTLTHPTQGSPCRAELGKDLPLRSTDLSTEPSRSESPGTGLLVIY